MNTNKQIEDGANIPDRHFQTEVCPLCHGQIYVHGTAHDRSVLEYQACKGLTDNQLRAMIAARKGGV